MTEMPPVALLAGGLATRLRPLTEQVPKAMLEVAGEPFIAHQLRLLRREGISRVVICSGYLAEQIEDYVGDGSALRPVGRLQDRRPETARHRRRAARRARPARRRIPGDVRRQLARHRLRAGGRCVPRERPTRPDDGVSQRRPVGHEQCVVRGRPHPALQTSASGCRRCITSTGASV